MIFHPGHVTMTSIEHMPGTDSLKVNCRMKFDDFLHDFQTFDDDRDLSKVFGNQPFPLDLVNKYFNSKVWIYVNNKLLTGKVLSMNLAENDISINMHYRTDKKLKKITIRNIMLTTWFSDQVNMTILRIDNLEKGIKLTPEHVEETFIIN